MSSAYQKTTGRSRRFAALFAADRLMKACADDLRKPGYVFKKPHNAMRDANRTKGQPFANCEVVGFEPADPHTGGLGAVYVQQKARSNARVHRLDAKQGERFIPAPLRALMGLLPLAEPVAEGEAKADAEPDTLAA